MNTKQDKKLSFANLAIEVTRKCNMHCAHCMRGDAQNADISEGKLSKFLSQVNFIGSLTITGGEPTLNVNANAIPVKLSFIAVTAATLVNNAALV